MFSSIQNRHQQERDNFIATWSNTLQQVQTRRTHLKDDLTTLLQQDIDKFRKQIDELLHKAPDAYWKHHEGIFWAFLYWMQSIFANKPGGSRLYMALKNANITVPEVLPQIEQETILNDFKDTKNVKQTILDYSAYMQETSPLGATRFIAIQSCINALVKQYIPSLNLSMTDDVNPELLRETHIHFFDSWKHLICILWVNNNTDQKPLEKLLKGEKTVEQIYQELPTAYHIENFKDLKLDLSTKVLIFRAIEEIIILSKKQITHSLWQKKEIGYQALNMFINQFLGFTSPLKNSSNWFQEIFDTINPQGLWRAQGVPKTVLNAEYWSVKLRLFSTYIFEGKEIRTTLHSQTLQDIITEPLLDENWFHTRSLTSTEEIVANNSHGLSL